MALMDRREGVDPDRAPHLNGYIRRTMVAEVLDGVREVVGEIYLANPDPDCIYRIDPALSLEQRAKILINATPRRSCGDYREDSRGLFYFEGVRASLREAGIVDDDLEALAKAVLGLPGRWAEIISPPAF